MPPKRDDDLTPITYKDMTGGLFERGNDRECAPNGLLESQDCMPLRTGGLRAAWAWKEEDLGALPTERKVIGFQVSRGGTLGRGNRISAGVMLGPVSTASAPVFEYWFAHGDTSLTNITNWTSGFTHTLSTVAQAPFFVPTRFVTFAQEGSTNGGRSWYYNIGNNYTTGGASTVAAGVFRMRETLMSTASTRVFDRRVSYIASHQDRLIYATHAFTSNLGPSDQLLFTNPTTDATPATSNFLSVARYSLGNICYMEAFYPQDLFVLKQRQGAYLIQGEIGSGPIVRELNVAHPPEVMTQGTRLLAGMAYLTENDGVWAWQGGDQPVNLSKQIVGTPMAEVQLQTSHPSLEVRSSPAPAGTTVGTDMGYGFLGALGTGGRWLFTPKGYIYDIENGFWFRTTLPGSGVFAFSSFDQVGARMFMAGHQEPGTQVRVISCSVNEKTMQRSGTFSATLPIIDLMERNVEVRRIEIFGQGFGNGGTWQLQLTNDRGETETTGLANVAARAGSARFNTKSTGDYLKIRLLSQGAGDAASPTGKSEAPMIDRIVVWVKPRQTRNTA